MNIQVNQYLASPFVHNFTVLTNTAKAKLVTKKSLTTQKQSPLMIHADERHKCYLLHHCRLGGKKAKSPQNRFR